MGGAGTLAGFGAGGPAAGVPGAGSAGAGAAGPGAGADAVGAGAVAAEGADDGAGVAMADSVPNDDGAPEDDGGRTPTAIANPTATTGSSTQRFAKGRRGCWSVCAEGPCWSEGRSGIGGCSMAVLS